LAEFLDEYCDVDVDFRDKKEKESRLSSKRNDLFVAYVHWAEQSKERYPLGKKIFYARLNQKGFPIVRKKDGHYLEGLKIKESKRYEIDGGDF
jgi:phage/plasmid-associated DNA primase